MTVRSYSRRVGLLGGRGRTFVAYAAILFAACLGGLPLAMPARAEILQISGTALTQHCPCVANSEADEDRGVLKPQGQSRYFAEVQIPDGRNVCSFSMVYRDVNALESMQAFLMKKTFVVGQTAFANPIVMATVVSAAGVSGSVRKATDVTIAQPTINNASAFYYVRFDVQNINLELLGLQIDVRATCPG